MKFYPLLGPLALFVLWGIVVELRVVDAFFLPGPVTVLYTLHDLLITGAIMPDLFATLGRVATAFFFAVLGGLPLGLWLGMSEKRYRGWEFIIDLFRSTPATALFPLFLLVFGVADSSKVAVATFASLLLILFNTAYGVLHAKRSRVLAARIMGATEAQIFRMVVFWESLPQTFIGLRSAASMSLVVIVAAEMVIGTTTGLGRSIIDAQITYEIPTMYATILLAGLVGYLLNQVFLVLEKKVLHWSGR